MNQAGDTAKKLELLKKARQLINQEYVARRAEQHRMWIENSEKSWRTNGALLPYPAGALYPSEDEVVAKALELFNLSNGTTVPTPVPLPIQTDQLPSVTAQLKEAYYNHAPETPVVLPPEVIPEVTPEVLIEVEPTFVEPMSGTLIEESTQPVPVDVPEEIPSVVPDVVVPDVVEPEVVTSPEELDKHTLLRSVLSSWLKRK